MLALDIETAPLIAYTFSTFKTTITPEKIIEDPRILCFSASWMGQPKPEVEFYSEYHDGADDMLLKLWEMLDEADYVVGYNINSFDIPWIYGEFIAAGLEPPSPFQTIDLYQTVKRATRFPSKRLAYVAPRLLEDTKESHSGFEMWRGCLEGDPDHWAMMKKYAVQDTALLEPLYELLRPWIKNHPNLALTAGLNLACPACTSENVQRRGYSRTSASVFQRFVCNDCGKWSRSSTRLSTTELRNA